MLMTDKQETELNDVQLLFHFIFINKWENVFEIKIKKGSCLIWKTVIIDFF